MVRPFYFIKNLRATFWATFGLVLVFKLMKITLSRSLALVGAIYYLSGFKRILHFC